MTNATYVGGGNVTVSISDEQVREIEQTLAGIDKGATTVLRAAINDTLRTGRTILARIIKADLNLPYGDILQRIRVEKQATEAELVGTLRVDYQGVPLIDYRAKFRQASGVTVTTVLEDGAQNFRHMFRATMQSGHTGIFERDQQAGKHAPEKGSYTLAKRLERQAAHHGKYKRRLKPVVLRQSILQRLGPAAIAPLENAPDIVAKVEEQLTEKFNERLASKVDWQLAKAGSIPPEST